MTVAADRFGDGERTAIGRWTGSLLVVLALHAGIASSLLSRRSAIGPAQAPPAPVMIDLAPLPAVAPADPQPAPEAVRPLPEPEPPALAEPEPVPVPEPEIAPLLPPEPVPLPQAAVALPLARPTPKPKPKPKPRPVDRPPVAQQRPVAPALPQPLSVPTQPAALPPSPSAATAARSAWQAQLLAWLSRHKRYPRAAQEQRQQGTAHLRFALDRHGRVLSFRLDRSSGVPVLDEEVTSLIQRAQPLPAPPAETPGERFELVVPVEFSLNRNQR